MDEINRVTAVTPGTLTALVLLSHSHRGLSHEHVVERAAALLSLLLESGVRCVEALATPAGTLRASSIREALQLFADGELVEIHATGESSAAREQRRKSRQQAGPGSFYVVPDAKRLALDTSKNIVIHFFVPAALLALAWSAGSTSDKSLDAVKSRFCELRRLLLHEFRLGNKEDADPLFNRTLAQFIELNLAKLRGDQLSLGTSFADVPAEKWLLILGEILVNYLEGYRVAARSLSLVLKQPLPAKEFFKRALAVGNRMYFAGELSRREAITNPILRNALASFSDQDWAELRSEKVAVTEAMGTQSAIDRLEASISRFVEGLGH
jgi:glycerol-3-phosphate O-acyltransferase